MHITDEIWTCILSHFEYPMPQNGWQSDYEWFRSNIYGRNELLALCLVNRQFRRIAQRSLYRSIPIRTKSNLQWQHNVLHKLIRTLRDNPILAGNIRAVKCWGAEILHNSEAKAIRALGHLGLHRELEIRMSRCLMRCGDASCLLVYTPGIQLVDCAIPQVDSGIPWMLSGMMGVEDDIDLKWWGVVSKNLSGYLPDETELFFNPEQQNIDNQQSLKGAARNMSVKYDPLPNLKEVRVRAEDIHNAFLPALWIEPILLNPNLKTLRTFGVDWYMSEEQIFVWPTHLNNLECLDLKETITDADALKAIMARCPKLKSLSVDLANLYRNGNDDGDNDHENYDSDGDGDPIYDFIVDLKEFGDVFREHGGNLEDLSFSTFHHEDKFGRNTMGSLGSLRKLEKLRHLKVEYGNLLGEFEGNLTDYHRFSDVLPASIEILYLYNGRYNPTEYSYPEPDAPNGTNSLVKTFLTEAETCAPNLRKVVVEWYNSAFQWEEIRRRYWSRETIDDGWCVQFVEDQFEQGFSVEGFMMTLVILTKKGK